MKRRLLIIEDDLELARTLKRVLETEDYDVETSANGDEGLSRARESEFDAVVTDLHLAGPKGLNFSAGLELITELRKAKPQLPVILMTAHHSTETAIEATKLGAYDYIFKEIDLVEELPRRIERAIASSRLMSEPVDLGAAIPAHDAIVGNSRVMQEVYKEIGRVASTPVTVLIQGETGTGKELVARRIYQHSDRAHEPFIVVNCVAIPENLLESELFGHERGAFTGAEIRRIGRFEQANRGTIFLDEIGDMTMNTQAKLLRVLQEKTIQRLGGKELIPIDVRIIAATHRDLDRALRDNLFREDLYYRLHVAVIRLPALRERPSDVPALVKYFLQRHGPELGADNPAITSDAVGFLRQQPWPGNVRELENVIRKALLLARGYTVSLAHIHAALAKPTSPVPASAQTVAGYVSQLLARAICGELQNVQAALTWDIERELYAQAIQLAQGNQAKAARWLGVSRPTMREKLTLYGLHRSADNRNGPATGRC
jgi:DNA-binding NtrC family response regulator